MQLPKKSRSRLDRTSSLKFDKNIKLSALITNASRASITLFSNALHIFKNNDVLSAYRHRLPQLVVALGLSFGLFQLMSHVPPRSIAHVLFPNSYLPIMSLWFLCWWYFGGFIFQSSKRGLLAASITTLWLYTRLQLIVTPWWWWTVVCLVWLLLEIVTAKIRARRI